jgi:phosphoribosylformylglycinamidine cyclo-ligase
MQAFGLRAASGEFTGPHHGSLGSTVMKSIDYRQAGVDYASIDPLKILAQRAAAGTAPHLARHGLAEVAASRGESAYVVDCGDFYLASITECLGTKALVADAMRAMPGVATTTRLHRHAVRRSTTSSPSERHRFRTPWAAGDSECSRTPSAHMTWSTAGVMCDRMVSPGAAAKRRAPSNVAPGRIDWPPCQHRAAGPRSPGDRLAEATGPLLASSGIHANGVSLARSWSSGYPTATARRLPTARRMAKPLAPTLLYCRRPRRGLPASCRTTART